MFALALVVLDLGDRRMPDSPAEVFRTHFKYLRAFATMCGHIYGRVLWKLLEERANEISGNLVAFPKNGPADEVQLRRSLSNAWGTELLLASTYEWVDEDDLIRINNSWAVVQAYYVQYHAIQALRVALGHERPVTHQKTQALFADTWAGRVAAFPPCTLGFGSTGFLNVPPGIQVDLGIHSWSACDEITCWSLASKALRTTREERIVEKKKVTREEKRRERRAEWRTEEQERLKAGRRPRKEPDYPFPRLTRAEHDRVERSVRPYTIMDYLYRLRIKANYLDSAVFLEGPEDEETSRRVLQELKDISAHVMLLHELHIRNATGAKLMDGLADEWIGARNNPPQVGLVLRRPLWS